MTTLKPTTTVIPRDLLLSKLTLAHIRRIDAMLATLPDYGEVRLIVQKGELRFINKVESYKVGEGPQLRE